LIRFPNRKAKRAEPEFLVEFDSIDVAIDVDLDELELTGDELELTGDELELTDDDVVLLDAAPPEPRLSRSLLRAALAAVPDGAREARRIDLDAPESRPISKARLDTLRTKAQQASSMTLPPAPVSVAPAPAPAIAALPDVRRAPTPRVSLDAEAESSVADECLASIAAVASHARASSPFIEDLARPSSSMPIASLARSSERSPVDDLLDAVPVARSSKRSPVDELLDAAPYDVLPRNGASRSTTAPSSSISLASRLPAVRPPPLLGALSLPSSSSFRSASPSVPGLSHAGGDDVTETLPVPPGRSSWRRLGEVSSETAPHAHAGADDAAETLPVPPGRSSFRRLGEVRSETAPLFARTSTDDRPVPAPSQSASSVAPVAVASAEPTVIVVRDRPRTAWVIAAAAIGALAAVSAMRFASPREATAAAPVMTTPTTPGAGNAPPAPAPSPGAVVQFGEEDGVSIHVPLPVSSAPSSSEHPVASASASAAPSHVARPATQSSRERSPVARPSRPLNPKVSAPTPLPDGSLGLASTGTATVTTPAPALAPLPVPQPPARKRALTPEQELAEAQLRAATR